MRRQVKSLAVAAASVVLGVLAFGLLSAGRALDRLRPDRSPDKPLIHAVYPLACPLAPMAPGPTVSDRFPEVTCPLCRAMQPHLYQPAASA